jgi:hypothetical protein|tara:strand:+ start:988 stop:1284 length:297 start_codon:yes stop_codon:yes gene_type:complete
MKKNRWTGYDRYLVFSDKTRVLKGNYNGYLNFRSVVEVVNTLHTKRSSTYLYNGELLTFNNISQTEIETIFNSWNECEYRRGFDKVRLIANKLNLKRI